jgi:outer membrane protein assembly factor BamE (lipoprotein component of BamABCDE complex)
MRPLIATAPRRRLIALAACLAALSLAGCMSYGSMVSQQQADQFKTGETTEAQIVAALGPPTSITTANGTRTLAYVGVKAQARAASFIPFIGPLVGGADSQVNQVIFKLDRDGRLASTETTQTAGSSGMGFASGTSAAGTVQ